MNRWFVGALITLALIILVSPGIVGHLAEKRVEENVDFAASESGEIVVTTESFERGWFTSEGRHRIALRDGAIRKLFEDSAAARVPALIVETHIDHGLVPVTSVSRESGSLMPGLASTISTLKIEFAAGELFEVPGKIYSQVGLTGETTSRVLLKAGSRKISAANLEWQGADVTVRANPAAGSLGYEGVVLSITFADEGRSITLGNITIEGEQKASQYDFNVGSVRIELDAVTVEDIGQAAVTMGPFSVDANSELTGDRVNFASKVLVAGMPAPGLGNMELAADMVFNGMDAQSFDKIVQAVQDTQASASPQDAIAELYPVIESDIQKLLTSGLEIRIDKFDLTLPGGDLTTKLQLSLPASDQPADFSWPSLLLALDASADVRLPAELFELANAMSPDVGMLVAMGILKLDDDYYHMRAEYAKGLVTVNGAPLPIPLPGM